MPAKRKAAPATAQARIKSESDEIFDQIDKQMGAGAMKPASDIPYVTRIPFGIFVLDFASLGGYAEHCGHMAYGNENCGKTTHFLRVVAAAQRKYPDKRAVWVDVENKFDPEWAIRHGVDLDRLHIGKPPSGEKAVDAIAALAKANDICIIVLDSIPALNPQAILDRSVEDPTMGQTARLVGIMCSKLQQAWIDEAKRDHKVTVLFINQYRDNVGVFKGPTNKLPGGRYQNYMVDTKLAMRAKDVKENIGGLELHTGTEISFTFAKSKGGFSIKEGMYTMVMDDHGRADGLETGQCDDFETVVTYAKRYGIVKGGGASWRIVHRPEVVYKNLNGIASAIRADHSLDLELRQVIIGIRRLASEISILPPDRYLLEQLSIEGAERIEELVTSYYQDSDVQVEGDEWGARA